MPNICNRKANGVGTMDLELKKNNNLDGQKLPNTPKPSKKRTYKGDFLIIYLPQKPLNDIYR